MDQRLGAMLGVLLGLSAAEQASALGTGFISSELISTRSLGEGGVGVAGASDDPTAAYTNPAALTTLSGTMITTGLSYLNARPTFTDDGGSVSGARATSVGVPDFAVTTQLPGDRLFAGLALVSPYGAETHFDGNGPLRYAATDSRLRMVDVSPAVALKVNDFFSIGAGADYYDVLEASLDKKLNTADLNYDVAYAGLSSQFGSLLGPTLAAGYRTGADSNSQLSGTGGGFGWHAGVTIRPNEQNQIGIVYHSNVKILINGVVQLTGLSGFVVSNPYTILNPAAQVFGSPNFTATATAPLYLPQNVQLGYAYMPNRRWKIELDGAWYDWYASRQIGIVYQGLTPTQSEVLNDPSNNPLEFHPRDTFSGGLGANYLAYNAIFFHTRHVDDQSSQTPVPLESYSGSFDAFAQVVSVSLTYRTAAHF